MKKWILVSIIVVLIIIVLLILYTNDMQMNECLEITVPKLSKRESVELQDSDLFNDEEVIKIYLSKNQTKSIINAIENNENWKKEKIDKRLQERLEFHTRENIYYQIPEIENYYWIFTNRSNGVEDKHSVDQLLEDKLYYAISFGILDIDNNILYYYEYDK